jgi:hypothetical protein
MKSYEQLAVGAYAAYLKRLLRADRRTLPGPTAMVLSDLVHVKKAITSDLQVDPVLCWAALDHDARQSWIEATKQVAAELALYH